MSKAPKKIIPIDILEMELSQGLPHWLHPSQKHAGKFAEDRKRRHQQYMDEKYGKGGQKPTGKKQNKAMPASLIAKEAPMPMNPSDYNSQSEFMSACISDMSGAHPDWESDRVTAACSTMWGKDKRARSRVTKQAPTPEAGETQEDFMGRCTALAMKENPDWDAGQAEQACSTIWGGQKGARGGVRKQVAPKEGEVLADFMDRCTTETASANPDWDAGKVRAACSSTWAEKRLGKNGAKHKSLRKQDDGEGAIPDPNEYDSKEEFMSDCMDATGDRDACETVWEDESGEERKSKVPVRKSSGVLAKQPPPDATDPNDYDSYEEYMADCVDQIGDETACDTWWNEKRLKGPVRKTRPAGVFKIDKEGVEFVLSDESIDRMGDVIVAAGWKLDNFKRNPVALFNHKADFVVGKWERLRVDGERLRGHLRFAPAGTSPRIDEIRKLVEAGILQAVSVGFAPIGTPEPRMKNNMPSGFTYRGQELIETSLVSVPANPNALAVAKSLRNLPAHYRHRFRRARQKENERRTKSRVTRRASRSSS